MKRPSFQFYPADWRKDAALQSCSIAARGLWLEMMAIAHECEPYGHLTVNGRAMTCSQIARLVGLGERECNKLIAELVEAGVPSVSDCGSFYSRRMIRDEQLRQKRADGGKAGSEFGALGAEHGSKGGRPKKTRGVSEPPLEPAPSSSSSFSSSEDTPIPPEGNGEAPPLCTLEQALAHAPAVCRMSPAAVEFWWHTRNSAGWRKGGAGNPLIRSWQSDMAASVTWAEDGAAKNRAGGSGGKGNFSSADVGI